MQSTSRSVSPERVSPACAIFCAFHRTGDNEVSDARNVLGNLLQICSVSPMTGFGRDGVCHTGPQDVGSHTVCALMTEAFLDYSLERGNDLVTPVPEYGFPGLKPGDRWCVCVARWLEAAEDGVAPPVLLDATHERALSTVALADLQYHALRTPDCPSQEYPKP
jgi:uncharacterized protein (DUF2237 family)